MWAKKRKLKKVIDISDNTIRRLIKEGHLKKGVHYGELPGVKGIFYNITEITKLLMSPTPTTAERLLDEIML